jgi:hypothetical protein
MFTTYQVLGILKKKITVLASLLFFLEKDGLILLKFSVFPNEFKIT